MIIEKCIVEEIKDYHRNLAVALYDYKKAYATVHHDWMLRVYGWMSIPHEVINLISQLMKKWKTRLEIWSEGKKVTDRWIDISCGFLQEDSYSSVGFCISEIQSVYFCNRVNVIGWAHLDTEISNKHIVSLCMI